MRKIALIVAGGNGKRMNSEIPKQFLLLHNEPILIHTIKQFAHFEKIILVLPQTQFEHWKKIYKKYNFNLPLILAKGGENRFQSVKNGLAKITDVAIVAIHDGVRPLVSKALINRLVSKTKKGIGIIPVIPIKDSLRKIERDKSKHINRDKLFQVQTPQCFISTDIKNGYTQEFCKHFTDDASVLEKAGGKIETVLGDNKNLKITTIEDLKLAEIFMQ
tara:strand:+ start:43 stop:696 length:654 start_codon:yes stop_codon:yes gene_type:complete